MRVVGSDEGTMHFEPGMPDPSTDTLRSALEEIGGLDERWTVGGDDIDLSIRLRAAGYRLILDRRVFVYHHAFKTGNRLYGNSRIPGGWNSQQMATRVYDMVAEKHGRDALMECIKAEDYKPETIACEHRS